MEKYEKKKNQFFLQNIVTLIIFIEKKSTLQVALWYTCFEE